VRDGRRAELAAVGRAPDDVPDPIALSTFRSAVLDWSERTRGDHADLLAWHRALVALRRARPALSDPRSGATRAQLDGTLLTVTRGAGPDHVVVHANLAAEPAPFAMPPGHGVLLASAACDDGAMPPFGVCITAPEGAARDRRSQRSAVVDG
jgi:maltooligosyltrehalose trehalohydrolase